MFSIWGRIQIQNPDFFFFSGNKGWMQQCAINRLSEIFTIAVNPFLQTTEGMEYFSTLPPQPAPHRPHKSADFCAVCSFLCALPPSRKPVKHLPSNRGARLAAAVGLFWWKVRSFFCPGHLISGGRRLPTNNGLHLALAYCLRNAHTHWKFCTTITRSP